MSAPHADAALICNPRAGALAALADGPSRLAAALEAAGYRLVAPPDPEAPLEAQWRAARAAGAVVIFVAGGDGTLRAAAQLAVRDDVTLAFLPGGTMNRVCQRLGLPPDLEAAAAAHAGAVPDRLSVGWAGSELFLYQSLFGVPVRLLRYREMQRGGGWLGWLPLLRALWRRLTGLVERPVRIVLPGGRRRSARVLVVTLAAPDEAPALRVELAAPRGVLGRLRMAWRWFRGRLHEDAEVRVLETRSLVVVGRRARIRFSVDGELRMAPPPLRLRVAAGQLRILVPAGPAERA